LAGIELGLNLGAKPGSRQLPHSAPNVQKRAADIFFRDQHVSSSRLKDRKIRAFGLAEFGKLYPLFALASLEIPAPIGKIQCQASVDPADIRARIAGSD
jgi:hypothetical protein